MAQEEGEKPFAGVWIEVERCLDCHSHEYCTRHIEQKYQQYEQQISKILDTKVPPSTAYKFVVNPGPKAHGVNCKRSDYNPYMYAAYAMHQNTRKWYQTQVFRYPRIGGFEVYVNKGKVRREVFSKLKNMKWPNPQWVVDKIVECVDAVGGWEPVELPPPKPRKYAGAGGKQDISDDELRMIMKKKFCTLIAAFKSFDRNGDGCVNRKEFGIGLKQAAVDLPPKIVDRIWAMADSDGTGALAYQEFARKFASYKATASLHREVAFKNDKEKLATQLHGTGAGSTMTKQSVIREEPAQRFSIAADQFTTDKHQEETLTIQQIARQGDLSGRDIEGMTPDEIRALCLQRHGNLLVAFRMLAVHSGDFKVDYNQFMQRMPQVLGKKVSALKLNELWKTMDHDFSGVIELTEFSTNKCLSATDQMVVMMKGQAQEAPMTSSGKLSANMRPDSAASTAHPSTNRPPSAASQASMPSALEETHRSSENNINNNTTIKEGQHEVPNHFASSSFSNMNDTTETNVARGAALGDAEYEDDFAKESSGSENLTGGMKRNVVESLS